MAFQFLKEVRKTLKELLIADPNDLIGDAYGYQMSRDLIDYAGLGISLFVVSLSTITSLTACGMVYAFSQNKQAQNSWDPEFAQLFSKKLEGEPDITKEEENP